LCHRVLVGTLYPLLLEAVTGDKISVGPPFFNLTFGPLMVPLLLAVPFGPMLAWKRAPVRRSGSISPPADRCWWAWEWSSFRPARRFLPGSESPLACS
jgi:cytochrome c-type biogenesis protein CcmF